MLFTSKSTLRYWKEKKPKYLLFSDLPFDLCIPSFIVCFQISAPLSHTNKRRGRGKKLNRLKLKFKKAVGEFLTLEFGFAQDTSEKEEKKKRGGEKEAELDMLIQEAAAICN